MLITLAFLGASYLLGSIPFGLVLTRLAGLGDIRKTGSGNIGATNVLRTGRKDIALATLLLDSGKGAAAVLLADVAILHFQHGSALGTDSLALMPDQVAVACGAAAFLGHCFPVWLGFKGGKGVATFFGTLLAVSPLLALACTSVWLGVAFLFRLSSAAGLSAALSAPLWAVFLTSSDFIPFIGFMTALIFIRHRDNISRLLAGTESKMGQKKEE